MPSSTPRRPDVTDITIIGGPETDRLVLAEPDPEWAARFEHHAQQVRDALGPVALDVHHVGSTSVPTLVAKPIIDMLLVVDDITAEEDHVEPLIASGYVLRVREPGHRLVRTPERDVHLHIHAHDDPEASRLLRFRDRLRSDAADRELYAATKRELITQPWTHMQAYADAKDEVVAAIHARAAASEMATSPTDVVRRGRS